VQPERGIIQGLSADVAVGDVVSSRHSAKIKIFDYKTKRGKVTECRVKDDLCFLALNPPGYLCLGSVTVAFHIEKGCLRVIGEEDLLVIPFLAREQKTIVYGQPGVGVVLVRSSVKMALKVLKILKPALIQYN